MRRSFFKAAIWFPLTLTLALFARLIYVVEINGPLKL
jgi:hypothetical protein